MIKPSSRDQRTRHRGHKRTEESQMLVGGNRDIRATTTSTEATWVIGEQWKAHEASAWAVEQSCRHIGFSGGNKSHRQGTRRPHVVSVRAAGIDAVRGGFGILVRDQRRRWMLQEVAAASASLHRATVAPLKAAGSNSNLAEGYRGFRWSGRGQRWWWRAALVSIIDWKEEGGRRKVMTRVRFRVFALIPC